MDLLLRVWGSSNSPPSIADRATIWDGMLGLSAAERRFSSLGVEGVVPLSTAIPDTRTTPTEGGRF